MSRYLDSTFNTTNIYVKNLLERAKIGLDMAIKERNNNEAEIEIFRECIRIAEEVLNDK